MAWIKFNPKVALLGSTDRLTEYHIGSLAQVKFHFHASHFENVMALEFVCI